MANPYNKPYLWEWGNNIPQKYHVYYQWRERQTNYSIFSSGEALPKPDKGQIHYSQDPKTYDLIFDVEVESTRICQYDYLISNVLAPIVNDRVLKILNDLCPDDFQAFPVLLRNDQDKPIEPYIVEGEYWLINITHTVHAFDKEQSVFDRNPESLGGGISGIRHMVLNGIEALEGHLLARDADVRSQIIVSPIIRDAFKKAKVKGCSFVTDEEYNRDYFY